MSAEQHECLSADQVSFYQETGYLVLENHLDMVVIQDIRDEIARLESLALGMTESDDRLDLEDSHTPMRRGSGGLNCPIHKVMWSKNCSIQIRFWPRYAI